MTVNIIGIGKIDYVANINSVLEAMGRGPNSLSRPAGPKPIDWDGISELPYDTTVTHRYMSDQGVSVEFSNILHGFANGDLPPLPEGVVWGVDGIISAEDALEAIGADNFAYASFNEAYTPGQQVVAALSALNLVKIADPPL